MRGFRVPGVHQGGGILTTHLKKKGKSWQLWPPGIRMSAQEERVSGRRGGWSCEAGDHPPTTITTIRSYILCKYMYIYIYITNHKHTNPQNTTWTSSNIPTVPLFGPHHLSISKFLSDISWPSQLSWEVVWRSYGDMLRFFFFGPFVVRQQCFSLFFLTLLP